MRPDRRTFLRGTAALLGAIGLPEWAIRELEPQPRLLQLLAAPAAASSGVLRLLQRSSFGPDTVELERAAAMGTAGYLDEQLHPEAIDDSALEARLAPLPTLSMDGATLLRQDRRAVMTELQQATLLRARYSRRQLQEVLVDFWSNHFNIFIGKGNCRLLKTLDDREAIRPHVLGGFRELLGASAHSPAMLIFLDNRSNRKQAPNENYARELMELHTLGVDGGYTEADVAEVARCLTGWTIRNGSFRFARRQHDRAAKTVLGVSIDAGGVEDGQRVLDLLAAHPSTATFIATKLCRRFIADDPPPAAVEHVAAVFRDTGGDLRQVTRAVLSTPAFDSASEPKLKRPVEYVVATLRALGANSDGATLAKYVRLLGQAPFGAPSPAGYPEHAAAWLSSSGMLGRWNWALAVARGNIEGVTVDLAGLARGTSTAAERAARLATALLPGMASAELQAQLAQFLGGAGASAAQLEQRTPIAAGLVLGSPLAQYR